MTVQAFLQVLASGLLMGLLYALVAVGLALIFGLMDIVNFAHGEFLMAAMYAVLGLWLATTLDPVLLMPAVTGLMFVVGVLAYVGVTRFAMRAKTNAGMVQIFTTFGLAVSMQGLAQFFFSPDYRTIHVSWLASRTVDFGGVFLPLPQIYGGAISLLAFVGLYFLINKTDFGRALEATREDRGAVALVGIDRNRIFALGWGLGVALVGLAGAVLAIFYAIHPHVGGPFALTAYVVVALGGFGSVFGALVAGLIVGVIEALAATVLPPAIKSIAIYLMYLGVVFVRPRGLFGRL